MLVRMRAAIMLVMALVSGCASQDYVRYLEMQERIGMANAEAMKAKYQAYETIGQGDTTSRVAALIAMSGVGGSNGNGTQLQYVAPPKTGWDHFKEVASIFVPVALQAYSIGKSAEIAKNASDNAARTAVSTNDSFVGMAGRIQAPAANITSTTSNLTTDSRTSTVLSGKGTIGDGSFSDSVTDRHDVTAPTTSTSTNSYNLQPTTSTFTNSYNLQPTTTTTTTTNPAPVP